MLLGIDMGLTHGDESAQTIIVHLVIARGYLGFVIKVRTLKFFSHVLNLSMG